MHRQKSDLPVSSFLSSGMWKYFGTCHSIHNLLEHGSYGLHMVFHVWCDMSWTITEHLVRIGTHGLFPGPIVCHSSMTKGCPTRIREFSVILALHVDWIDCSHTPLKSNFWGHETPRWGGTPVLDALNHVESLICSVLGFKVCFFPTSKAFRREFYHHLTGCWQSGMTQCDGHTPLFLLAKTSMVDGCTKTLWLVIIVWFKHVQTIPDLRTDRGTDR